MDKDKFIKWIFSMFYYRYKIKIHETDGFYNEVYDNLDQLINSVKEECAKGYVKNLNDTQKEIYNAFIQCFENESYNIDKFLLWVVKRVNVEQSIFLHEHNQIKAIKFKE